MPADGRCCYIDLDSTLLGYGGSILKTGDNAPTDAGIRALEAPVSYTHLTLPTKRIV